MSWHLSFTAAGFTRSQPQPSARFPWFDHRSRNRSPPIELSGGHDQVADHTRTVHAQHPSANTDSRTGRVRPFAAPTMARCPVHTNSFPFGASWRRRGYHPECPVGPAPAGTTSHRAGRTWWLSGLCAGWEHENGPCRRWRWPRRARRGRPAGSEPVCGRASPEMRPEPSR